MIIKVRLTTATLVTCLFAGIFLGGVGSSAAATYYVSTNGNNSWAGTSWATAKLTVEAGLALATADNDEVIVSNGVYLNTTVPTGFKVTNAIWLHSFENDPQTVELVGASNRRVITLTNGANARISGFTLRDGTGNDGGGGIYMTAGTVSNCVIRDCKTANSKDGGGIYMTAGLVTYTRIETNWGKRYGSGIYTTGGAVTRCMIANNTGGSGIHHAEGSVPITDCTIIGHTSRGITTVDANISGCTFISNSCPSGNTDRGGALIVPSGIVERCTFLYNYAKKDSGAVDMQSGILRNCLIVGSLPPYAATSGHGGVRLNAGSVMENCTVVGNGGGGIEFNGGYATNTISIFNDSGNASSNYYGTAHFDYSCTLPIPAGVENIGTDPLFADSGSGFGASHVLGDYALTNNSPCLDKGIDLPGMETALDRTGNTRIQGKKVDMGAYEFAVAPRVGTIFAIH